MCEKLKDIHGFIHFHQRNIFESTHKNHKHQLINYIWITVGFRRVSFYLYELKEMQYHLPIPKYKHITDSIF